MSIKLAYPILLLLLFSLTVVRAQPYVDGGETRFRFAQTYFGAGLEYSSGGWTQYGTQSGGVSGRIGLPARVAPTLTIGGLHFWGHADFYVTFPLPQIGDGARRDEGLTTVYSPGVETGARIYPWRIEFGRIVPFVGASWNVIYYEQTNDGGEFGPTIFRHRIPLQAGFTWLSKFGRMDAGASWNPLNSVSYPLSRTASAAIALPPFSARLGYSLMFDATLPAEAATMSGAVEREVQARAARGELNAFGIAAGMSTAFTLGRSSHNQLDRPSLDDRVPSTPYPDLSIGYYHNALDASVNLSFRPITQWQSGYGIEQQLSRTALSLEAIKFLADYHGFTPFVGLTFGHEWLRVTESDRGETVVDTRRGTWAPGVIFGWDIRPTRMEPFLLRTNLRYTPGLKTRVAPGRDVMFDQLEFNFIQVVVYPGRIF